MKKLSFKTRSDGSIQVFSIDLIDHEGGDSPMFIGVLDRENEQKPYSFELKDCNLITSNEILELAEKIKEINPPKGKYVRIVSTNDSYDLYQPYFGRKKELIMEELIGEVFLTDSFGQFQHEQFNYELKYFVFEEV